MYTVSSRSLRLLDLPQTIDEEALTHLVEGYLQPNRRGSGLLGRSPGSQAKGMTVSVQPQYNSHTGTVTLPSSEIKKVVFKALMSSGQEWHVDDEFHGLTVLHSCNKPEIDICAVHGLNGNAFDTFAWDGTMWLRDLLPKTQPFDRARIMTFGYTSQLRDSANVSELKEWADDLLNSLEIARGLEEERKRPLLLVCHSLGGLVARQAMVRLDRYAKQYEGLDIRQCGLLFLATPHSGSPLADWNDYLQATLQVFGVRRDLIALLKSFNPQSSDNKEAFANMHCVPPFYCFYESRKTQVGLFSQYVVPKESAGLLDQVALPMTNADHRTICRFQHKYTTAYMKLVEYLEKLKRQLSDTIILSEGPIYEKIPGQALADALHYPRAPDRAFYEGSQLLKSSQLKGRNVELSWLEKDWEENKPNENSVIVTGIGGIGKTQTLLEFSLHQRDKSDVFFINADNAESLHRHYFLIAMRIGHHILSARYHGEDVHTIWNSMSTDEKVEAFKFWLSEPANSNCLFIADDLDKLVDVKPLQSALPTGAKHIYISTRRPDLVEEIQGTTLTTPLRLKPMEINEIVLIMKSLLTRNHDVDLCTDEELRSIAKMVHGHPLAGCHAIRYISQVISHSSSNPASHMLSIMKSNDYEARRRFLDWEPSGALSIMNTFLSSKERLPETQMDAWELLKAISFLETNHRKADFRDFIFRVPPSLLEGAHRTWLRTAKPEMLAELENVSFGLRESARSPFQINPLWLECMRHLVGHEGRVKHVSQTLSVCYDHAMMTQGDGANERKFHPHIASCLKTCQSFNISFQLLDLNPLQLKWLSGLKSA